MKQLGLALTLLLAALLVAVVIARVSLSFIVGSEAFRSFINHEMEHGLQSLLPTLLSDIKSTELDGLATLEIEGMELHNSRQLSHSLSLPRLTLQPVWASLWDGGPWRANIEALVAGDGRFSLNASAPDWYFRRSKASATSAGTLRLEGNFTNLDAVALANLVFPDQAAAGFYLSQGFVSGNLILTKPVGSPEAGTKKNGKVSARLTSSVWILAEEKGRQLSMPQITLNLELIDEAILIRSPIVMTGRSGKASLSGALHLPLSASEEASWNLVVNVDNDSGLSHSLAKLFKCQNEVKTPRFSVKGPVTGTTCLP